MGETVKYVVITPVRDEQNHIEATIRSVCGQTMRPAHWVIVDDGSTDGTPGLLDRYAAQVSWIQVVHRPNRGFRKSGGGVVEAFYDGYGAVRDEGWEFIVKLDGDLSFSDDYFERCFEHFGCDPQLGIGGGGIYHEIEGALRLEVNPRFHVRGATKIYRKACWEAIGGLVQAPGWDTIDELKANMLGWRSYSFVDLRLVHHRLTGMADGLWRDRVKHGLACYVAGYHPLFLAASCLYRLKQRPYIVGSVAVGWGFVKGYFTGVSRQCDAQLMQYVRRQQLRRLCGLGTIWK
jgi:biofilm PGA synthesis N-glycosyltransferase PgaC